MKKQRYYKYSNLYYISIKLNGKAKSIDYRFIDMKKLETSIHSVSNFGMNVWALLHDYEEITKQEYREACELLFNKILNEKL